MIICFANQKGGVGKSTLSIHLAHAIAQAKKRVLLIDGDPQSSVSNWADSRENSPPFTVIQMARNTLHRDLPEVASTYDHTVIDSPPRTTALSRSAILASDLVIIPVQPSSYDIWAAGETVELIREAQQFRPEIQAVFLINRKVAGTAIGNEVGEALADYKLDILTTTIGQRIAFAESSAGQTVLEFAKNTPAAKEIVALGKELLKVLGIKSW